MSRWDSTCGNGKDMLRPTPCARAGRGRTKGRKLMPEYRENELCYEDYRALRTLAGWETHSEEQTRRALAAALYDVTAVEDGRAVAMGRLVGTGCTTSSRTWWSRRNTRGAALERLWQKSFWPMPKAGCLRADARAYSLLRPKARRAFTKSWAFGKCRAGAAALRCGVCCTDTRRNKEKALSRGLLAEARAKAVSSVEQLFAAALPDTYTVTVQ